MDTAQTHPSRFKAHHLVVWLMVSCLCSGSVPMAATWAATGMDAPKAKTPVVEWAPLKTPRLEGQVTLNKTLKVAPDSSRVSLRMRDTSVRDVLNILARQGGFNVVIDPTITGNITVDIDNVSLNKAMEYVLTMGNLRYNKDGNTLLVYSAATATTQNVTHRFLKALPVRYRSASSVAQQLNNTVFKDSRPGVTTTAAISYDEASNSILILGSDNDVALAQEMIQQVDVQPLRRMYKIQHSTPAHVAQVLALQFGSGSQFGGAAGGGAGGGGAAGGAGGGGAAGGAGGGGAAGGAGGGGAAGGAGGGGAAGGAGGGGGAAGATNAQQFTTGGMTFISEPVSGTLTVMGTADQLTMIDSIIDRVDVRRPQVSIEVALVEISKSSTKVHRPEIGTFNLGEFRLGLLGSGGFNGFGTNQGGVSFTVPTISLINQLRESKGKILANPTVVALEGTTSQIQITDQVATFSFTVTATASGSIIVPTPSVQNVGITLSITPQVTNDGSVTLTLNPQVTQLVDIVQGGDATTGITQVPLIATRQLTIAGVRVKDGETLLLGGLLQERKIDNWNKVPGLANLPIVGAMFRATDVGGNTSGRSELLVMVTPHILNDDAVTYFEKNKAPEGAAFHPNDGKMIDPLLSTFPAPVRDLPTALPVRPMVAPSASAMAKPTISPSVQPTHNFGKGAAAAAAAPPVTIPLREANSTAGLSLSPPAIATPALQPDKHHWSLFGTNRRTPSVGLPPSSPTAQPTAGGNRPDVPNQLDDLIK